MFSGNSARSCGDWWKNCSFSSQVLDQEPIIWKCVLGPKISLSSCHTPQDKRGGMESNPKVTWQSAFFSLSLPKETDVRPLLCCKYRILLFPRHFSLKNILRLIQVRLSVCFYMSNQMLCIMLCKVYKQ